MVIQFVKLLIAGGFAAVFILFTIASIRTLTLDGNVGGLQLAHWETPNVISLDIDQRKREELLVHFQGTVRPKSKVEDTVL